MYKIYVLPQAQKDLDAFQGKIFSQVEAKLAALSQEPRPPGSIKLIAEEGYRLKSGDYRIVYRIDDKEKRVFIYRIKHRKDVYK